MAISIMTEEIFTQNQDFFTIKATDYEKFLVISLGTGMPKDTARFSAKEASKWGILGWLYNDKGSNPLIDMFTQASDDMVDIHTSILFQALHCEKNYLRIQVCMHVFFFSKSGGQVPLVSLNRF